MKLHKIEILIVNHDDVSEEDIKYHLENTKYPNYCISPEVLSINTREIEWSDDHPLNHRDTQFEACRELFKDVK